MIGKKKMLTTLATVGLVLAVAGPSAAIGGPRLGLGSRAGTASTGAAGASMSTAAVAARTAARDARAEALKARIGAVLARRRAKFELTDARMRTRLARLTRIADKVAAAGGDVTATRTSLASASAHLTQAEGLERSAVAAFQAVPSAADRRQAFLAARDIAKNAGQQLVAARADLKSAIVTLRADLKAIRTQNATSGTGSGN